MRTFVMVLAGLAFAWGALVFFVAKGGIHEVYGALSWVAACLLGLGAAALGALQRIEDVQRELLHELKMQRRRE